MLDPLLRSKNQNGFVPGRSTVSQILALLKLIEVIIWCNLEALITFQNFSKAFDFLHRGKLMNILRTYGILKVNKGSIQPQIGKRTY
jgi:hypothetical protein